jgi:DNA polymerase-3 subunit epsilon
MRQVVLDTETTGLSVEEGHRLIEVGCIELVDRRLTGRSFHHYLNPEREIDAGAIEVHGITLEKLSHAPRFAEVAAELLAFLAGDELVIHNAAFDLGFLNAEFARCGLGHEPLERRCAVIDTLHLARQRHPGQRNSLDALCKRYQIDNSQRQLHGALLDAQILAEVYLAMTGGQVALTLDSLGARNGGRVGEPGDLMIRRPRDGDWVIISATEDERVLHERMLVELDQLSGGRCLWRQLEADRLA